MQRACAHMQHVPAASPIIGPGYEARLMSDPREPTYILVCLANYKKLSDTYFIYTADCTGDIRLVDENNAREGRVELRHYNDIWGTV